MSKPKIRYEDIRTIVQNQKRAEAIRRMHAIAKAGKS